MLHFDMFKKISALLLVGFVLAGCSVKLPGAGQSPRVFVLSPKSTFPAGLPDVKWQLLVDVPQAAAGIASHRIALRHQAVELEYFSMASWTDDGPKMIQSLLVESFENSKKIISVGRQAIGLRADYRLTTDLREFQAEYMNPDGVAMKEGEAPYVRVRINAKLVRMPQRDIVSSQTFEHLVRADNSDMNAVIATYDVALGKTLKKVVAWTLNQGEKFNSR